MRKLFMLALGMLVISCQSSDKLTLKAQLPNVADGTEVYISQLKRGNTPFPIDTAVVKNGKVEVALPTVDFQTLNVLKIDGVRGSMLFVNENKPLTGAVYKDSLRKSFVKGGPANALFSEYTARLFEDNQKTMDLREQYSREELANPEVRKEIMAKQKEIAEARIAYGKRLIANNTNALPTLFVFTDLMRSQMVPQAELQELFDNLSPKLKSNYIGVEIGNRLAQSSATAVGSKAPLFTAKTPDGKEFGLKDALAKGKYTLVDFWASWCKPCRLENPNLVKAYQTYQDKGFNILGVSLDRSKDKWVEAIKKDGLLWDQISNLQFWQDPIAKQYNIRAIPANFLLDENGVIVARDLRGAELEQKLKELFGDN